MQTKDIVTSGRIMSAAKMVADSTQSDTDSRKKRNRSSGRRGKKSSKRDRRRVSTQRHLTSLVSFQRFPQWGTAD